MESIEESQKVVNSNSSWEKPMNSNLPRRKISSSSTESSSYGERKKKARNTSNSRTQKKRGKLRWEKNLWDEKTGFSVGTESNIIAHEILAGGTREEIVDRLQGKITTTTKGGKSKQISSQVSAVAKKLRDRNIL